MNLVTLFLILLGNLCYANSFTSHEAACASQKQFHLNSADLLHIFFGRYKYVLMGHVLKMERSDEKDKKVKVLLKVSTIFKQPSSSLKKGDKIEFTMTLSNRDCPYYPFKEIGVLLNKDGKDFALRVIYKYMDPEYLRGVLSSVQKSYDKLKKEKGL